MGPSPNPGLKRKYGSPKKRSNEATASLFVTPDNDQKSRRKKHQKPTNFNSIRHGESFSIGQKQGRHDGIPNEVTPGIPKNQKFNDVFSSMQTGFTKNEASSSMNTLGRFGVWHPEDSVFRKEEEKIEEQRKTLLVFPNEGELKSMSC